MLGSRTASAAVDFLFEKIHAPPAQRALRHPFYLIAALSDEPRAVRMIRPSAAPSARKTRTAAEASPNIPPVRAAPKTDAREDLRRIIIPVPHMLLIGGADKNFVNCLDNALRVAYNIGTKPKIT